MKGFNFIVKTPPDEEYIMNTSRVLGEIRINKYGIEITRHVLDIMKNQGDQ